MPSEPMKTRTGKIARLPKAVREQLNQRLADGEPCGPLLAWLHSLPEVLEVLVRDFAARPILKQNLSEWRQGGFLEWEARQERLARLRLLADEADELEEASPRLPDRLAALLAGRFASVITTMQVKDWSKPRQLARLMELNEAVATLRRFDQGAARLKLEGKQLEIKKAELQVAREAQTKRTQAQWREGAREQMQRLFHESKTPGELTKAVNHLIFGEEDEDKRGWQENAGSTGTNLGAQMQEDAAGLIKLRDEIKAEKAGIRFCENQIKMRQAEAGDAIREVLWDVLSLEQPVFSDAEAGTDHQPASPKESQTQSNLVKPTRAPPVSTAAAGLPAAGVDPVEEESNEAVITHPPKGKAGNEEAASFAGEPPETPDEDPGGDPLEPDVLRSGSVTVLLEQPSRLKPGRLC
ncbi:MAG TPA: hypothetical protein DIT64_04240 [Verrucomicrobiales bacterium]|nr:hypothetical protein [Verrucomicrobiales bacterium]